MAEVSKQRDEKKKGMDETERVDSRYKAKPHETKSHETKSHHASCGCIPCRIERYKRHHEGKHQGEHLVSAWSSWMEVLRESSGASIVTAIAGSGLCLYFGYQYAKQWQLSTYASLSTKTPASVLIGQDPSVFLNDATETFYCKMTTDPSLGIIYIPCTGIYQISVVINGLYPSGQTSTSLVTSVVRNGFPNDPSTILRSVTTTLVPNANFQIVYKFQTHLNGEDYVQVFDQNENLSDFSLTRNSYDFIVSLLKPTIQPSSDFASEI